jgi:hypothetical protein
MTFSNDPIQHVGERMVMSKRFLEVEGFSGPALMLFGSGEARLHMVVFTDDEPRELAIALAVESNGAWPFDGAVFSSEIWVKTGSGPLVHVADEDRIWPKDGFFNVDPLGGREEALSVVGITASGEVRELLQPFARTKGGIVFGEPIELTEQAGVPDFLRPIWRRWPRANWPERPSSRE